MKVSRKKFTFRPHFFDPEFGYRFSRWRGGRSITRATRGEVCIVFYQPVYSCGLLETGCGIVLPQSRLVLVSYEIEGDFLIPFESVIWWRYRIPLQARRRQERAEWKVNSALAIRREG